MILDQNRLFLERGARLGVGDLVDAHSKRNGGYNHIGLI